MIEPSVVARDQAKPEGARGGAALHRDLEHEVAVVAERDRITPPSS